MANLQKNNRLTLIEQLTFGTNSTGLYQCSCGNIKKIVITRVNTGRTKSCGCYQKEMQAKRATKHGLYKHPLYKAYDGIKYRCYNEKSDKFKDYGALGIYMCEEWYNDFMSFFNWAISNGWKPGFQIDKDLKGGMVYSPTNCVITTCKINSNHRRSSVFIEYNGKRQTMSQWAEEIGINYKTLKNRIRIGWSIEKALTKPFNKRP